jgi:hypothetical protein
MARAREETRFERCEESVRERGGARSPSGVCASAGRKAYGKKRFQEMAAAGRKRQNPGKHSQAWEAGYKSLMIAASRHGTVNLTPSTAQREDWGHQWREFMAGWKAAQRASENPKKTRFEKCVESVEAEGGAYDPAAVCASAGRKKYGKAKFQKMAEAGKRKAERAHNPVTVWSLKQGGARARVLFRSPKNYEVEIKSGRTPIVNRTFTGYEAAIAFARLTLHDVAHNPSLVSDKDASSLLSTIPGVSTAKMLSRIGGQTLKRAVRAVKGRRNPEDSALAQYEKFHGFPADAINEIVEEEHYHEWTWTVGRLVGMTVVTVDGNEFVLAAPGYVHRPQRGAEKEYYERDLAVAIDKIVFLAANEEGNQLFAKGGDQYIDYEALGMSDRDVHDHMLIGTVKRLWYDTRKTFEADGKEDVNFYHDLGQEGSKGVMPVLEYKPRVKRMFFVGGRYYIAPPDPDLQQVSPGIVG